MVVFFFFKAEDGIRDLTVTGVQTCALPILFENPPAPEQPAPSPTPPAALPSAPPASPLGPLPPRLDFSRWQVMTARERQAYVEGAVTAIDGLASRLRAEVVVAKGMPPEGLTPVLRFV